MGCGAARSPRPTDWEGTERDAGLSRYNGGFQLQAPKTAPTMQPRIPAPGGARVLSDMRCRRVPRYGVMVCLTSS